MKCRGPHEPTRCTMMLHRKSSDVSSVILTSSDCDGGRVAGAGICEGGPGERECACVHGRTGCVGREKGDERHWILPGRASQFFSGEKALDNARSEQVCGWKSVGSCLERANLWVSGQGYVSRYVGVTEPGPGIQRPGSVVRRQRWREGGEEENFFGNGVSRRQQAISQAAGEPTSSKSPAMACVSECSFCRRSSPSREMTTRTRTSLRPPATPPASSNCESTPSTTPTKQTNTGHPPNNPKNPHLHLFPLDRSKGRSNEPAPAGRAR